ncbi:STT3 domain-containing protein [Methanotorris igneus]|uniref:dolichyl-phosphooligosaccharide-protein glycotransferase n=1 Tax=Methanotorris igneus (strain DSM 5666 / JCM 11834 / Kol 5) TaxID=880724 RepID=F6BCC3_METIK|nr:STT3 domain-containing protein [Methanotorris igneus]AEF97329.1 Oligosaccharyl transferase STT3 subunit [Methanotorris igneus Kol 5]
MIEYLNKVSEFFKKHKHIKIFLIVLAISLISFQLRAQTADMGFTDNPQLKKMFADEHGRMYLIALDPYYYLRLSENLYKHGYIGETLKEVNGKLVPYDTCQYAPPGHPVSWEPPVICIVEVLLYEIWHSIDPTVSIMNAAFWVPAILSMLLGIPIYFIVRRATLSNLGGIVGALALISAPGLLYKTSAGFADTPIFEVLPILFIMWFIIEAIHNQNNIKKSLIFGSLAVILTALYPKMWGAWWYAFDIVSASLIIYGIYLILSKKLGNTIKHENVKNICYLIGFYIAGSALLISMAYGVNTFLTAFTAPLSYQIVLTTTEHATGWPNVYTTVAELSKPSFRDIVNNSIGGITLFILGIIGIFASFISLRHGKKEFDVKYAILLTIWLLATGYAATKGIRFAALMTPPLAIGVGILVGQIEKFVMMSRDKLVEYTLYPIVGLACLWSIANYGAKIPQILIPTTYIPIAAYTFLTLVVALALYKIGDIISSNTELKLKKGISLALAVALVLPPLANAVPFYTVPTFNNGWKESLDWIKNNTPDNAVITCWWDNGHIYTWATRKMVTFDGGSQNSPRAYWVGRAFSTSNEELAVGILRMLATSGDEAFKKGSVLMNKTHNNVSKTVKILNEILPLNRSAAYEILTEKYGLTDKEAKEVLNATHPKHPNPDYLITYNRMTDIAPVWSMFGNWNFDLPPNTSNDKREKGYYFKGKGVIYNNSIITKVRVGNLYYMTNIPFTMDNISTAVIAYKNGQPKIIGQVNFHKIIIKTPNGVIEKVLNKDGQLSEIVRVESDGRVYVWIATRNLEDSIYTRLHFLDGYGLKHIKLVKASYDPTNFGVQPGFKVYEVDYGKEYLK